MAGGSWLRKIFAELEEGDLSDTQLPVTLGSKPDDDSLSVTQSTQDKAVLAAIAAVLGAPTGAAVTTDIDATIQRYLRGIAVLAASTTAVKVATRYTVAQASSSWDRPATAVSMSIGHMLANSADDTLVTPFVFTVSDVNDQPVDLRGMRLSTNDTAPGLASVVIRAHIFSETPVLAGSTGDNLAFSVNKEGAVGVMEGTMRPFANGSACRLAPVFIPSSGIITPTDMITVPAIGGLTVQALLETRTAFTTSASLRTYSATVSGNQGRV